MKSQHWVRILAFALLTACMALAVNQADPKRVLLTAPPTNATSDLTNYPRAATPLNSHIEPQSASSAGNTNKHPVPVSGPDFKNAFFGLIAATIAAWIACYYIIRYEHLHAHLSHDLTDSGPQKYHALPTPRIGGLALAAGLLVAALAFYLSGTHPELLALFGLLLFSGLPAFLGGMVEDLTKRVGVLERLILTMLSAALAALLLDAILRHMEIPILREALTWIPFAVAFTVFAVGGVANAINIIDGYHGLAPGYALITLASIAWVAAMVGDTFILHATLGMAGAVMGFFVWNWPKGRIFLGDGGAYLLGFWLAELCVLLVVRNPGVVYARLCLALMIYPVFETIFTIYRRKMLQKQNPGQPDNMHFHQLMYKHQVRNLPFSDDPIELTRRNGAVAPKAWLVSSLFALATLYFWDRPGGLVAVTLIFCIAYVWGYFHLLSTTKNCA
jgi:UDP-N-acetylmuramyl pentapeptide phosphotransferase/UDP-N-acetylglucosamine-1-phosphate transferase